ncbi:S8 family peptidase [Paenibacillus rhizovicinus]|uniref:S8 family peptidase n=1 Tax=Paenibacillus rhizovicinus TaxID=2704463 RepID=UPI001CDC19EC|nr:S8 family peptidase [Paenibacillus rhizovicinus]
MEKLLLSCSTARSTSHTSRKLISFKRQDQYARCMRQLANYGIKPLKSIQKGRVIVCHIDGRRSDKLRKLARHPDVSYVEPDFKVHAHGIVSGNGMGKGSGGGSKLSISGARKSSSSPYLKRNLRTQTKRARVRADSGDVQASWNISQVQAHKVWPSTRGSAASIGIIDTGIGKHPDLRVSGGVNTMGGSSYADDHGHGTHVAGIAASLGKNGLSPGVAPNAKLYAVKALDANGAGYVSDLIKGIEWCIKKNIKVINMSLGLAGETSSALKEAVQRARKNGITVVASAGNDGPSNKQGIDQPARYTDAIAVAASTRGGKVADYSSRGYGIDVTAPGSFIKSARPGGGYAIMSGTSMSCPHVAGGVALLKSLQPNLTAYGIKKRLRSTAKKISGYGTRSQGYGVMQLFAASGLSESDNGTEASRTSRKARGAATASRSGRKSRKNGRS